MALGGRKRLGVVFGRDQALILAVAGGRLAASRRVELAWDRRGEPAPREAFLAAAREVAAGLGRAPAWVSLPSREAALHLAPLAPRRWWSALARPAPPPLERLTPLAPEEVRWSLRRARGPAGGDLAQIAVVRRQAAEEALALVRAAGLHPRGLDLRTGYAARAAARLAGEADLFVLLTAAGAEWASLARSGPGLVGSAARRDGEGQASLAARACQQAVQLCGLDGTVSLVLAGEDAQAAARSLEAAPGQVELRVRSLAGPEALPPELAWEGLAMFTFLAGGGGRTTFDLMPRAEAAMWLARPAATRRLAWLAAGLLLAVGLQQVGGAWWAKSRTQARVEAAREQTVRLREQTAELRARLEAMGPLERAGRSRDLAGEVLPRVAALLPDGAWLERLEVRPEGVVAYLGGVDKARVQKLLPARGMLSPAGPLKKVTAPGSGRPAVKAELGLGSDEG
jgi:hypothetical protein